MVKAKNRPHYWTKQQEMDLFNGVSISGIRWFVKHCGRSAKAVYNKLAREHGAGGLTRGAYSFWELSRVTGYSRSQLKRAQAALGQKWKRLGPKGVHIITEEQLEELVAWLAHDYWSVRLRRYACAWCATSTRSSYAIGLCLRCYKRHRWLCGKLSLPTTIAGQLEMVRNIQRLGDDKAGKSAKVVKEVQTRLEAGLALTEAHLDWLALLAE